MVFLSNYLVFKIVLAALGRTDYPVAGDLELKYDTANKIYLSGGSLDYVDDYTLYTTIGGETTTHVIPQSPRIDFNNETKLTGEATGNFGSGVSIDGDYLAITDSFYSDYGKVYIYHRSGTTWSLQNSFQSATTDDYMEAVAISGDYVMAGVRYGDNADTNAGEVLVYKRSGTTWTNTQTLTASDAANGDHFGYSITIKGNHAVVGTGSVSGAYVFTLSNGTWSETQLLTTGTNSDLFGHFVNLSDTDLLIGARGVNSLKGTAYIYTNNGGTFTQQAQITPDDLVGTDWFGQTGDIFGDYACVGAPYQNTSTGAAYIFKRSGKTWTQQQKLTASNSATNTSFGYGVHLMSDDTVIIGAYNDDAKGADAGAAYLFQRTGDTWSEIKIIYPSDIGTNDFFGHSISSSETDLVISGPTQDNATGNVYLFPYTKTRNFYITDAGKYSVDATIAGLNYKTNELDITSVTIPAKVVQVSAGYRACAAVTEDGSVYIWGNGSEGRLAQGSGDVGNKNTPVKVKGVGGTGFLSNIKQVSVGGTQVMALANDGTIYSWGSNGNGQLGVGGNTARYYPTVVPYSGEAVSKIHAGHKHSLLCTVTNGYVYACGENQSGQIGDGTDGTDRDTFTQVKGVGGSGNISGITHLASGNDFSVILNATSGLAYGFGRGDEYQLSTGDNTSTNNTPRNVKTGGSTTNLTSIADISCGEDFSYFLISDGTVYASGEGSVGEQGDGANSDNTSASICTGLSGIVDILGTQACGFARKSDGTLYVWGNNTAGQFASGSASSGDTHTPTEITSITGVEEISAYSRGETLIARKSDGSVFCWGEGTTGSIGNGLSSSVSSPTQPIPGAGPSVDGKFNLFTEPRLTFDGYNKLSLLHGLSGVSSKLFLGSNVYDIGTLTSDLTIETPGLYKGLVFDTSSNVAYFNKTTVGAIASTMAGYEVEQILYGTQDSDAPSQGGFGHYIDTNGDGTRFVLGMGMDPTTGQYDGRVKVFHLESGTWTLKVDLATPNTSSQRFGDSVCMNEDGTRIVVNHYPSDYQTTRAYIFDYASGAWPTTPTATIIGGVTTAFGEGDMDMNKAGTVIVFGSRAYGTQIWSRAGDGTWSETKNWGNGFGGYGVAINGAGTRIVTGKASTGQIFEGNYVGGSWGSLTSVIDTSYTSWPAKIRMDSDGTTLIVNADPATEAGIYERQSGTSWTLSQSILSMASYYSRNGLSISYDGNMILVGDMTNDTDGNNFGRAFLWNKSGGSWSLTKTFSNPKTSPAVNDYWGAGVAIAKNTKDRIMIGMSADSTAGTQYGSVYVHTNAIPDFISFDTYNKLSLSGITNPTSKIHALPTGAESTTVYDIGTATNIYIESEGTYTAEMKAATKFALDSNVVGTVSSVIQPILKFENLGTSLASSVSGVNLVNESGYTAPTYDSTNNAIQTAASSSLLCDFSSVRTSTTSDLAVVFEAYYNEADGLSSVVTLGEYSSNPNTDFSIDQRSSMGTSIGGLNVTGTAYLTDTSGNGTYTVDAKLDAGDYINKWSKHALVHYEEDAWWYIYVDGEWKLHISSSQTTTSQLQNWFSDGFPSKIRVFNYPGQFATGTYSTGTKVRNIEVYDNVSFIVSPAPKLDFDGFNKYTFTGADTGSTYKLKYFSNTYDLGTITNVYIAHPGTYSAEIKGATNFGLSSNTTGSLGTSTNDVSPSATTISFYAGSWNGSYEYQLDTSQTTDSAIFYELYNIGGSAADNRHGLEFRKETDGSTKVYAETASNSLHPYTISINSNTPTASVTISGQVGQILKGFNSSTLVFEFTITSDHLWTTPKLDFDGYNKLTFSGLNSGSTSNVTFDGNTYSIGTASNVYISETGTYDAESKGTTTFALTSKAATVLPTSYIAFHHGAFTVSDYSSAYSTVGAAATAGHVYSDTTPATYTWGTLNSVDTSTSGQTGYSWTPASAVTADVIMVAGGGGGSYRDGGGGGAGGLVYNGTQSLSGAKTIVVGAGGDKGTSSSDLGDKGNNTTFTGFDNAIGGGGGNNTFTNNSNKDGGSGGGGSTASSGSTILTGGSGTSDQGNAGGNGSTDPGYRSAGAGGGGAGAAGGSTSSGDKTGADGGIGLDYSSTFGTVFGDSGFFAGGGGGGSRYGTQSTYGPGSPSSGGQGGGGGGGASSGAAGTSGTKHTGGGGGGGSLDEGVATADGGDGGSGIVIIRTGPPPGPISFTHDGYKLVVSGITPTSSKLKYESNTYEIGTATNIYVENTGAYTAEIGNATDFAFTNNTVSGTIKTIEPGFASRNYGKMALTYDGKLYAWGQNGDGEAGVGTSSDITVPTLCTGITQGTVAKLLLSSDITDNSRGEVSAIKTTDGKIYMAGKGDNNCIPGETSDQTSFTDVTSYFGDQSLTANTVTMMSFTDRSGAALTETGNVWTWGTHDSTYKALGQASASSSSTPKQINFSSATDNITKITSGHYHSLALDSSGNVWFWGKNGINSDSWPSSITDEPQKVVDGKNIIGLSSSFGTMYAFDATGKMWNAGNNYEGQIGDGTTTANSSGKTLTEVTYFSSKGITINKVHGGGYFVFADTSDGYYYWGSGGSGAFGNGSTGNITSPAKWTHVSNIKKFVVSTFSGAAITEDGKYYAWGRGTNNARGDNDTGDITYPKYINQLPNILAPSFEFDGYDKVFVNRNMPVTLKFFSVNTSGWNGGVSSFKYQYSESDGHVYAFAYANAAINASELVKYSFTNGWQDHPLGSTGTNPEYVYKSDGTTAIDGTVYPKNTIVMFDTSNNFWTKFGHDSSHPDPFSHAPSAETTKYTKGTRTYDVGKASIITVPDPGTYDAQLSQDSLFSLKSTTVPATSSTGLYTWAFHHGNFDNAYGDGDILTARDNGRFYADTPAFTSASIGTITPSPSLTPTYLFTISAGGTSNTFTWNGLDSSWPPPAGQNEGNLTYSSQLARWQAQDYAGSTYGESPGQFNPGVSGVANYGPYDIQQTEADEDSHITFTNNEWSITHGNFTWKITRLNGSMTTSETTYTFAPPSGGLTANVLMVAGGGGGGPTSGGSSAGGGAGGLLYYANQSITTSTKTIVVGNGGANHVNGNNTTFTDLDDNAIGGGRGATAGETGGNGGSGGGTSHHYPTSPGTGVSGQGNAGGNAGNNSYRTGGGGGGAGGVGGNSSTSSQLGGVGGIGLNYSGTFGTFYGESGFFAGGGAGCSNQTATPAVGGTGGGGYSSTDVSTADALSGQSHTGGGGGGAGGAGGSGIVLLQTNVATPNANSEVKIPEPHYHVLIEKPDDTHFSHLPNGKGSGSTSSSSYGSIVPNIPRADGLVSNVFYASSSGGYFYAEQAGSLVSTVEGIFYPIAQQRYDNILEIGHNSTHDIELEMAADGTAKLYRNNGGNHLATSTVKCFTAGKWHHIALTLDTNRNAVGYVNGYPVVSATYASAKLPGSRTEMILYRIGVTATFQKFLMYYFKTYNSVLNQNQILKLASSVGLGPKLEYDGLNTIKILNTESGSTVKLFTSNVADTSNVFIVADPAAGEYTVPESGKYYAEIKGTDTFTITKTIDVSGTFPLYQYPPIDGTTSSLTPATAANSFNNIWTISGASTGNGQYQVKCNTAAANNHYNAWRNNVGETNQWQTAADPTYPITFTILLPSAKTIRKYRMFPLDHANPNGVGTSATPGTSIDPTLPGNGGDDATKRPKSWVIRGSNNDSVWTDLDTVTNKPISIYGDVYSIDSPASYQYYQVSITANNGGNKLLLGDIQLWGDA